MFGGPGTGELLLVALVALCVFGPKRLPELGRMLGKGIREFQRSIAEIKDEMALQQDPTDEQSESGGPS